MMKLRHLFGNPALAEMLAQHWAGCESIELFRISANAIYRVVRNQQVCYLRISPTSEKTKEQLSAELELIRHLRANGYQAAPPIPASNGEDLITQNTPWGEYCASLFQSAHGIPLSQSEATDEIISACGSALAQMHQITQGWNTPHTRRPTHQHTLHWIQTTLQSLPDTSAALNELEQLKHSLAELPITEQNYGLIHFDFEPDNIFYDAQTSTCNVIDFDDSMLHWYVMDIAQALTGLKEEFGAEGFAMRRSFFLEGYQRFHEIDRQIYASLPTFTRFASLLKYTRIRRALQETWQHEPTWMLSLRDKLNHALHNHAQDFGKPYGINA